MSHIRYPYAWLFVVFLENEIIMFTVDIQCIHMLLLLLFVECTWLTSMVFKTFGQCRIEVIYFYVFLSSCLILKYKWKRGEEETEIERASDRRNKNSICSASVCIYTFVFKLKRAHICKTSAITHSFNVLIHR